MQFLYAAANFLILAAIVAVLFGKSIVKMFRDRREAIDRDLTEAEGAQDAPEAPETVLPADIPAGDDAADEAVERIRQEGDAAVSALEEQADKACGDLRYEMVYRVRDRLVHQLKIRAAALLSREPYRSRIREQEESMARRILENAALTPGDRAYIARTGQLYVSLVCAFEPAPALTAYVEEAARRMVEPTGGTCSFRVRVDPALIGGLQIRIGDTVYGCSVEDELYYLGDKLRRRALRGDETAEDVIEDAQNALRTMKIEVRTYQRGRVISVSDGICWMDGLADIMYGEVVEFDNGDRGMVLDIKPDRVGCIIYGRYEHIESGDRVRRVGRVATVPVGDGMLGRVVDPLGRPIDGKGSIRTTERRPIEAPAPAIHDRASVSRPLHTGLKAVDALVPIGRGQRELIIGDRQTGKSALALDTIIRQKGTGTACIYVAIGQKESTVADIRAKLERFGAMEYTTIVCAPASGSASFQYIAPFAGTAMAEHFLYSGRDALIVYDDLSKHAVAYRELSLLLHRPSGREAYPGDVFYLHARLLERAAQLSEEKGGGSLTALPLVETQGGDISAYIPTNVISITDGQIFLEADLFNEGQRPAVNVGLSVSRVGGAAQTGLMKQTAGKLRIRLAQYRELAAFAQFGSELDAESRATLEAGARMMAVLRQGRFSPMPDWQQALVLFAVSEGAADHVLPEEMSSFEQRLIAHFESAEPELCTLLAEGKKLDDAARGRLREAVHRAREVDQDARTA